MKKVAVFGNASGGKSTLARRLPDLTQLPLYPLDLIQYRPGGAKVEAAIRVQLAAGWDQGGREGSGTVSRIKRPEHDLVWLSRLL
jgi:adenylate kinase family enzyme